MANGRGVRPKVCKQCGALASDGYAISFRGLCATCGVVNMTDNATSYHRKAGPAWERWRARMREVIGDD